MSAIGASGVSVASNAGRMFIRLKPRSERRLSADEIIQELRQKVSKVPGIQMFMQNLPPIRIGGRLTKSQYQYTLQSPDTDELYRYSTIFEAKLRGLPQLQDVTSDLQIKNPQMNVEIDRDKASALGISALQIENALGACIRIAAGINNLCADESISGDHGSRASISERPLRLIHALYHGHLPGILFPEYRYQTESGCRSPCP